MPFATLQGALDPSVWPLALDVLLKCGIAALLAGLIGYERELHGRPAGIRTHILLAVGVVLFCEASRVFDPNEPARIAAQVVTGVGFLGAGTILRIGAEIKGLTSAASLWAVSGIGMAVSAGGAMVWVAVAATLLTLFTLAVMDNFERRLVPNAHPRALNVRLQDRAQVGALVGAVAAAGGLVKGVRFLADSGETHVQIDVQGAHDAILAAVAQAGGVLACDWAD